MKTLSFLAALLVACPFIVRAQEFDLVIRGGRIVDGTGAPADASDVAVRAGRIVAVGKFAGRGRTEIDATGRVVAPGFIDVHTHSEDIPGCVCHGAREPPAGWIQRRVREPPRPEG